MHTEQPSCVGTASFEELCETGLPFAPGAGDATFEEFGPLGGPELPEADLTTDPLEAFVDAWGVAGPNPSRTLLPKRIPG